MQAAELKAVRCAIPELARWSFSAEQQVLRRLDKTFKAFFARGRGFPRFRATARYHAAEFRVGDGLTIRKGGRIGIVGECACTLDRDVAAAKVVHFRAFGFMPGTGSGALSERVAA